MPEDKQASKKILPVGEKYAIQRKAPTQNPVHMLQASISPQKTLLLLTYSLTGLKIFDILRIVVIPKETRIHSKKSILYPRR